jgi:hypothetical protein
MLAVNRLKKKSFYKWNSVSIYVTLVILPTLKIQSISYCEKTSEKGKCYLVELGHIVEQVK